MSKASEYSNFGFTGNYLILMEKKSFSRTESGKSWKKKPDEIIRKVFTPEHYNNYLSFVPCCNDRVTKSCTVAGYLPTTVTSTRPDGQKKSVATFQFFSLHEMKDNAGWLENEVIKNATTWEEKNTSQLLTSKNGFKFNAYRHYITLINPNETGVTHSATYEENTHTWH